MFANMFLKIICYLSYFSRHDLACLHFNENLQRKGKTTEDARDYIKVTFPKYKPEEETARKVAVTPTYSKYYKTKYIFELSSGLSVLLLLMVYLLRFEAVPASL